MRTELETMSYEIDDRVARLTFNRPHVLHAMDNQTVIELEQVAEQFSQNPDLRVVLITGTGRSFSTGIDLKQLSADEINMEYHHHFERALRVFETMDKIVIAAVNGWCLGGALQLALACDLRISSDAATYGLPAIKECLIPGLSTFRLARYIGMGRAKFLILTGENIDAAEAHRIGMVDYLVPANEFEKKVEEVVGRVTKMLIPKCFDMDFDSFRDEYMKAQEIAMSSPDAAEAKKADLEDRDPVYG
jgi:enoyl-CoA hydratase/carnithine racemase